MSGDRSGFVSANGVDKAIKIKASSSHTHISIANQPFLSRHADVSAAAAAGLGVCVIE